MQQERRRLPNLRTIRELAQNRLSKKVAVEAGVSFASAIPPVVAVGPLLIGTVNLVNAGMEAYDVRQGKEGSTLKRAAFYAACGIFEFGLLAAGASVLGPLEGKIFHHFGIETPDIFNAGSGILSSSAIGFLTGAFTNTFWYEAKRKGLIPYTPADIILSPLRLGRRNG